MRKIARVLLIGLVLAAPAACGDDDDEDGGRNGRNPLSPAPAPTFRANMLPDGLYRWTDCFGTFCNFAAGLRNAGAGCAIRVEGSVRFFSSFGQQVGNTYRFALPPQQIVTPGQTIPFFIPAVPTLVASTATEYVVSPVWIDTPCF